MAGDNNVMQERRKTVRRQADRDMIARLQGDQPASGGAADRRGEDIEHRRRRTIRHTCKVGIQMLIGVAAGGGDEWTVDAVALKGRLLDLSAGGASIFTQQPLETGQALRLTVELRNGARIHCNGVVRWVKALPEKGGVASGVQLEKMTPADKRTLARFLSELDATAGL